MDNELRERVADAQHQIWAHWMRYQFSCGAIGADGSWTMPADKVERWQRQMGTAYVDLTERERESDLVQADKVIAVLSQQLAAVPLDAIRRTYLPDISDDPQDVAAIQAWLKQTAVQP